MKKVKISFSKPVKLNRHEPVTEVIIDKTVSEGHNSIERDIQYILCNAMSDMRYKGLKSFNVEIIE
tara:strand:- start:3310 stop:3507 length:198 start_codon:yes stop_codon:yes gene_type:complete